MKQINYQYLSNLDETRHRLKEWGSWYRATLSMGLDFSSKSIVGQLIDAEGVLIRGTGEHLSPENERAEEIDKLINELAKEDSKTAKVLCYHYVNEEKTEVKISSSGMARRTYFHHLSYAEEWINKCL